MWNLKKFRDESDFWCYVNNSVSNRLDLESVLFCDKRRQKAPQLFLSLKMTPLLFLLHFYVTIFPKSTQNLKKKFDFNYFPG